MNLRAVEKVLKNLQDCEIEKAIDLLKFEREKLILQDKGEKTNEIKGVKNYLKRAEKDIRLQNKILWTIQEDTDGKPFVCDGYSLVKWHEPQDWLNSFDHTPQVASVKASGFIPAIYDCAEHKLTDDEKLVLKNINKYIKLYKDGKYSMIKLFNRYWDAEIIKGVLDIIGNDIKYIYTRSKFNNERYEPIAMFEETITAMVLPMRLEETKTIEERTNAFIKQLKERN